MLVKGGKKKIIGMPNQMGFPSGSQAGLLLNPV